MASNARPNTPGTGAPTGPARGVLFDIDDTLVDLRAAMKGALIAAGRPLLPGFTAADWDGFAALYVADPQRYYERYIAGEFTFTQQRGLRARTVFAHLGYKEFDDVAERAWIQDFEKAQPRHIKAFDDVAPALDALDAAGIPYGAVSNNVHDYQRAKLDHAGLARIQVLVGIDTVNAAKPEPRVFWEGCRQLGVEPEGTLYVGDNLEVDGLGSHKAGLRGVWLDRKGDGPASDMEREGIASITTLAALSGLLGLPSQG